jgi:hypothetical protein
VTSNLPAVGAQVVIIDGYGRRHTGWAEDFTDRSLTISRLTDLADGDPLLIGDEMTLSWPDGSDAVIQAAARMAAMRRQDGARVWDIELLGEPRRLQRRQHVRAPVTGSVTLTQIPDAATAAAAVARQTTGNLVDVSEVGLRCSIGATQIWASRRNCRLRAVFAIDGEECVVAGRVLLGQVSAADASQRELVLLFDEPAGPDSAIGRYVRRYER